ncbi:MAG: hypothetical protein GY909_06195 [Oligoflexia bacterium]|nr:hypothetical protein [Oligoflexia bacterium]
MRALKISFLTFLLSASSFAATSLYDRNNNDRGGWSPWKVSYFNLASRPMENPDEGRAQIFTYNYFSIDYKLSGGKKYSIRPVFFYETSGFDDYGAYQKPKAEIGDIYVQYVDYDLAYLPGDVSLSGQFRFHLPTSKQSKKVNQIAMVEGVFTFEKLLAKMWSINYEIRPKYYIHSQTSYLNEFTYTRGSRAGQQGGSVSQNKEYKLEHGVEIERKFNKLFGMALSVGMEHQGWHASEVNGRPEARHTDDLNVAIAGVFDVSYRANFILSVEHSAPVHNARRNYKLGRGDEMGVSLLTFVRF